MAVTDTSGNKAREDLEADIREMRAHFNSPGAGRGKLIIIAVLGFLVLAGAAGGAWFVFAGGEADTVAEEDLPPVVTAPRKLAYIDLKPIFIPVEFASGAVENVVVSLSLEIEGENTDRERIALALPRLYEAYLRALTDRPLPGAADGKVEVIHIKNRIRAENLRLLGPGVVHDVILNHIWDPNS